MTRRLPSIGSVISKIEALVQSERDSRKPIVRSSQLIEAIEGVLGDIERVAGSDAEISRVVASIRSECMIAQEPINEVVDAAT